jgi:hypothetical protein
MKEGELENEGKKPDQIGEEERRFNDPELEEIKKEFERSKA